MQRTLLRLMDFSLKTINGHECEQNKLSDLYEGCLKNDIDLVQALLATSSFEMINCRETNGSTALHAAVECGHTEIVRLLLHDYGVLRHLSNSQGFTAFELAQTDEIRQSFQRSTLDENRFCNKTLCSTVFTVMESNDEENNDSRRVERHENYRSILDEPTHRIYEYPNNLFLRISDKILPYKPGHDRFVAMRRDHLLALVEEHIGSTNKQYQKAQAFIQQYYETGRVDSLFRLYTLETPFYTYVNQKKETSECLASTIYYSLRFLRRRAFKGFCYRGLGMTKEELEDYQWVLDKTNRYLVTNTFCSTTRDKDLAQGFAQARAFGQRLPVLIEFNFSTTCFTAIQLQKLADHLPAISEYENEQEVLILPQTTFRVTKIDATSSSETIMYLTFYPHERELDDWYTILAQNISEY